MLAFNWPISFQQPEWLWLLVTIPVLVPVSLHFLRGIERTRRMAAITLRSVVIVLLAAALAQIEWVRRNDNVAVMFVLDHSRSIPANLQAQGRKYIRDVTRKAGHDDRVGVIGFDGQAEVDVMSSRGGFDIVSFGLPNEPDRTNIAAGIRMAMAAFPDGFARRIVLLTDGNQNSGGLAEEIRDAAANNVAIDVVPLAYQHASEVLLDRIVVPTHSGQDTKIALRLIAKSQRPTRVKMSLYHNGQEVKIADPVLNLSGRMRPDPFTIPVDLHEGGVHRFEARITPLDPAEDSIVENNQATAFTFVEAQGRVLVLGKANAKDDAILVDALRREKITVEYQTSDTANLDLLKLQEYSVAVLANVPAETFNSEQHKALASYVRDFGGGIIMTGGDEGLGAGGWIGSPLEEVSPVSFKIPHRKMLPIPALVLVLDRSGSMASPVEGGPLTQQQVANESAILATRTLLPEDMIGVVAFDAEPTWVVKLERCRNPARIEKLIRAVGPGGGTNIYPALLTAYEELVALGSSVNIKHIILLTDGQSQEGPYEQLGKKLSASGVTLSTIGVGDAMNNQVLKQLAELGDGTFYPVKNPRQLPQIFIREARVVKRALIDNRPFHPVMTTSFDELTPGLTSSQLPSLGGLVLAQRKPDAMTPIVRQGTEDGEIVEDPVLAHWNFEMGKMAVFTSGLWDRWGQEWSGWGNFGKFWAQIVRWAMQEKGAADFDITTRLDGSHGRVVIEAFNKDASYLNFLRIRGKLVPPSGEAKTLYLTQTGPGRYEADFDVNDHGNYLVSLVYNDPNNKTGIIKTGLSVPYSAEYREMDTDFSLLDEVAAKTNGRRLVMDPVKDDVFRHNLPPAVARQPMWRFIIQWLLLPLFLLDVASRRLASTVATSIYVELAVFVMVLAIIHHPGGSYMNIVWAMVLAECVGWAIRWQYIGPVLVFFTAGARGLSSAGQRGVQSLAQLKGVREKVREDMAQAAHSTDKTEPSRSRTIALEPVTDRKRQFDMGNEQASTPTANLTESLGGAMSTGHEIQSRPGRANPSGGSLSDRLRKAKQRAQDQMKEQKDKE